MFYLTYILRQSRKDNFFGQYGTFAHGILEKYKKGDLELFELYDYCLSNFDEFITTTAPPNKFVDLYSDYKQKLLNYFYDFKDIEGKVEGVEKSVEFDLDLGDRVIKFVGFIDLLIKDVEDELEIWDYKSKSAFKKNEHDEYLRQLYLYSIDVFNHYGKYPKELNFEMFKIGETVRHKFDINRLNEAKQWVSNTLNEIYKDDKFETKIDIENDIMKQKSKRTGKPFKKKNKEDDFFCKYICSQKDNCDIITTVNLDVNSSSDKQVDIRGEEYQD